ncbi:MAG TPA: type II toxin-antitoxin system VapC family toxin [Phototrophicaceae bacterium]|nr:type II toxin-antitoxin system VapC family toxin [Phototrophicaceae bacterium]
MSIFFVDTSTLAKRYLAEAGSAWVQSWIVPSAGNMIVVSEIALAEVRSLLARRVREGLPLNDANSAKLAFLLHMRREYQVIALKRRGLVTAGDLTEKYPLRTLDAIHLAAALQMRSSLALPVIFITADKHQAAAAASEGFAVDDANAHP